MALNWIRNRGVDSALSQYREPPLSASVDVATCHISPLDAPFCMQIFGT